MVKVINKRINTNDTLIKTIGFLLDYATENEVNTYFNYK